ncbi:hypothetical protein HBI56_004690 [Parastagonospora nodorum]|uniref:Uncharacterized protein n=1 Tax=Phaeosphaeria nodorum (strain SN15 / ATCC MYA-4574 / FGSC 10173) TaxID=321614 RepID=A0A7U2HX21_PHANO|nr:hypothetical protein HBH56_124990 [Parastagonospora nodorum]QRC91257.1 hypothetical protein JI435_007600 [Parastagonospora nodorum SN15]KAH3934740.1 hypothetical protein HBH54_050530 [Parastagonospora nodorum]KAH3950208.1 hypothetical protein HBH53_078830 [Parastagonospora nodorum]KAH3972271.1 hypothetical protein HBH52_153720 [Parastagonospora nodorum]
MSQLDNVRYQPLAPYTDDDTLLCPRYAENDPTSAPPSPASIESFDILDSIPWRRSYISLDSNGASLSRRWRTRKAQITALVWVLTLLLTGCAVGGYVWHRAVKHGKSKP